MPGFDRTGPEGKGPKTGRGFGKCASDQEELEKTVGWRLFGSRRGGRGRRFRNRFSSSNELNN